MSIFAGIVANKLRNRLLGGSFDESSNPTSSNLATPPTPTYQTPGFWQSLVDHKLGIDELAPLKAQLLDAQIKEQVARNARYATENQHADTIFGLTAAEMGAKNESQTLANTITKANMANQIETSKLNLSELQSKVAGTDTASLEQKARSGYYNALTQEKQLDLAKAYGEAVAGTQVGPQDIVSLTDQLVKNAGVDKSQEENAKLFFGPAIAGSLSQGQQKLNALKQTNDTIAQQKRMQDITGLIQFAANSSDPAMAIEGAGRFIGLTPDTIAAAKEIAGTMKQPVSIPREDERSKVLGKSLGEAEDRLAELDASSIPGGKGLTKTELKERTSLQAKVESLKASLDAYQQGAVSRQVPKKSAPNMKGNPGAITEGSVQSAKGATLSRPVSIVSQYLQSDPNVGNYTDEQLGAIVDYLNKKGAKTNLADLKGQIQAMSNTHD